MIESKKVRKRDFTDWFRTRHGETVLSWNHHSITKGPRVPYAGRFKFETPSEILDFLEEDFGRFASLSDSIDQRLTELKELYD